MKNSNAVKEQNLKINVGYNRAAIRKDSTAVQYKNQSTTYRDKFMCFMTGTNTSGFPVFISFAVYD